MTDALRTFEIALATAAHERINDKIGRHSWWPCEAMRARVEPDGYAFDPRESHLPPEFAEWCWNLEI